MKIIIEESFGVVPLRHQKGDWQVFIILHKKGHHWSFPKGHPNQGEDPKQSAIRELQEETALSVEKILQEESLVESYSFYRDKCKVQKTVYYFPAIVSGEASLQEEEIQDGKWVSFDEAKKILTYSETRHICDKVQSFLTKK